MVIRANDFLSCNLSPIENARRLAEHNQQETETLSQLRSQIANTYSPELEVRCNIAAIGSVALGIFVMFASSFLVGGCIMFIAIIPITLGRSYNAKLDFLMQKFQNEVEGNLKFIGAGIILLFAQAMQKKNEDLITKWNNKEHIDLGNFILVEDDEEEFIQKQFQKVSENYDNNETFTLTFNHSATKIRYKDLTNYAGSISLILPQEEKELYKRLLYPNNWTQDLQKTCRIFHECQPRIEITRATADVNKDTMTSQMKTARCYYKQTGYDGETGMEADLLFCFLKRSFNGDN